MALDAIFCDRCGCRMRASSMSYFNRDVICMDCKRDEKQAPGYQHALDTECAAVQGGNLNYPGVGLSAADQQFLQAARAARSSVAAEF